MGSHCYRRTQARPLKNLVAIIRGERQQFVARSSLDAFRGEKGMLKAVASPFCAGVLITCSAHRLLAADIIANQPKAAVDQSVWSAFSSEHQHLSLTRGGA